MLTDLLTVAVLDDYQHVAESMLDWSAAGPVRVTYFHDHIAEPSQLIARLQPYDVVMVMRERTPLPAAVLEALPRLRLILATGRHNDVIDLAAARRLGKVVSGTAAPAARASTTELTWALIFATARHVVHEDRSIRAGGWQTRLGTMLHSKRLGLVGLGQLGRAMIPVARALGMEVTAWSRNLTPGDADIVGATYLDRTEFFSTADVVSVHIRLSSRSVHYVGAAELALLKPSAILVNTSRAAVVDQVALIRALQEGRIAGAGLDVFESEPLEPDHPLRHLPNTVLSPHKGYVTVDSYRQYFAQTVENLAAFRRGRPIRELV